MGFLKAGLSACALVLAFSGTSLAQTSSQPINSEMGKTEFGKKVVSLYIQGLSGLLQTEAQGDSAKKQIQGRINTVARCAAERSYLVGETPEGAQKRQYVKEMNLLTTHYVYFALAMERQGLTQSEVLISQFKSGASNLGEQIASLYETAKTNAQYGSLAQELSAFCKGMADEMETIESVIAL